jgi:Domain of unknown function (DUF4388)
MDNQNGTVDRMVEQLSDNGGPPMTDVSGSGALAVSQLFESPASGGEAVSNETDTSEEAAASLAGSLSVFSLSDVLSMLASTAQTGELQVVSETVDGRVWLDRGELTNAQVDTASTVGQAVFELACVTDGWFYFTTGLLSSNGQPSVPVMSVLNELGPQVDEWRQLSEVVPLGALVSLSPEAPGQDIQIRNDEWRVLTTVGTSGHTVRSVLEMIGGEQIVGLRSLRDLHATGLIELAPAPVEPIGVEEAATFAVPAASEQSASPLPLSPSMVESDGSVSDDLAVVPPPIEWDSTVSIGSDRLESLADVAMMPPPIAGDPWAPISESEVTDDDGVA